MTKEQALEDCRAFDVVNANLSLWVLKRRASGGFGAESIDVTDELSSALKGVVSAELAAHSEVDDYSLLAQVNEVGCLHVGTDETAFLDARAVVDRPAEEHRVGSPYSFRNLSCYLVRLRSNGRVMYCVKQVTDAWRTKKAMCVVNVVFRENRLDLVKDPSFTIAKTLDFIVLDNDLFVFRKRAFESLLKYKVGYSNSFQALQEEPAFIGLFSDLAPLVGYVGSNAMHLRRMAAVHERGYYADADYMARLRDLNAQEGWNIQFDGAGRIVPTEETMRLIMQVLLNHRLFSRLSLDYFDVPSTSPV